ncbi:unnamed protein product [Polarella glacialis]|uniref:Uncharacterized protein n=1 Tax=Polarella glacialis TaxID=89957 RepID=A0A813KYZ8_POLGL|nr:unnamed protein product [Polarella glacialis]
MMDFLEVDKPPPLNGYQMRAMVLGMPLPKRGPAALDPFRAVVHSSRALAFLRLDAYDRAAEDADLASKLEPKYLKAWIRRATALAAANRREDALQVLDEALEKACVSDVLKEQVCKLIVNLRALGPVQVVPPEQDLPVVYKDNPCSRAKKKKPQREVVKVPLGMMRSSKEDSSVEELTPVFAEVDRQDLDAFLREDWHATHLGRRWRQSRDEVDVVLRLPRKPKVWELRVQIRPRRLLVLLRKIGATGNGGQDDFDTLLDAELSGTVRPAESSWELSKAGTFAELHFSLEKLPAREADNQAADSVTPCLWARAFQGLVAVSVIFYLIVAVFAIICSCFVIFILTPKCMQEGDEPVDLEGVAAEKAAKARASRDELLLTLRRLEADAKQKRKEGDKDAARAIEKHVEELRSRR